MERVSYILDCLDRRKSIALRCQVTNEAHTELHYGTKTLSLVLSLMARFHFFTPLSLDEINFLTAQITC